MKREKQLGFEILKNKQAKFFGGAYLKNSHAKVKRPITTKRSMHLVLRSSMAKGQWSFLKKEKKIKDIILKNAKASGIKIYRFANAGNHLHLIILPQSRKGFQTFVRAISGIIAREITGSQRGGTERGFNNSGPLEKVSELSFWDKRPFTRIIEWGNEFRSLTGYLDQNSLEAWGFIPFKPRRRPNSSTA